MLTGTDLAISADEEAEWRSLHEAFLNKRIRDALPRTNPSIPAAAIEEACRKLFRWEHPTLVLNNRQFHRHLVDGIDVEVRRPDGTMGYEKVWLLDFDHPDRNDWLVVNQFVVVEGKAIRRPDVVVFVNGLPLAVIELKNPVDEKATVRTAYDQLQTYKKDIPGLFVFNEALIVSDGLQARAGTITAVWDRFMPWKTIDGNVIAPKGMLELEVLIRGAFDKTRFLDLVRNFIVFEADGQTVSKKLAGYHQFHAVNRAVDCTVTAAAPQGDRRVGVVWHTQGSGKSLTMAFFAGKLIGHPALENPTLVILTDRNDLDDQLYNTFCACADLLRQKPIQVQSREDLRKQLNRASGGVVFTTIQKFFPDSGESRFPLLSDRRNIVVIADEAHRSQYDFIDGYARYLREALPKASFIGFTGTPIELEDKSTRAVFGDDIHVYDIQRAVADGATVPIYYEGRLAKLELNERERPTIDPEFEDVTEGEEQDVKEKLKTKWARLEAMVGTPKRVGLVAQDIVDHFEKRLDALQGKGMIVCMSRRICVELYREIVKLRPRWDAQDDDKGELKIVMTGSASDPLDWQGHIRNKPRREALAKRFKDAGDPLKLVIVRDMWLTGFDVPPLHTMYLDKPIRGHTLLQAIARVNRVFKDKPGGLIVDYLGLADQLKQALSAYTQGDRDRTAIPQEDALAALIKAYEVVKAMLHGFAYSKFLGKPFKDRMAGLRDAADFVLGLKDGKPRFLKAISDLSRAFALAVPHEKALAIRDEVGFFQGIRAVIVKTSPPDGRSEEDLDAAIRQLVAKAVAPEGIVDIFKEAGLKTPDISILSDEFLAEVQGLKHKNLALELLKRLINDEIKVRMKTHLVRARSFAEMLEQTIHRYQNRTIEAAQVIAELVELAKKLREDHRRGENVGLSQDELAFYDALETNDSAVKVLGDATLRQIAQDLVKAVRANVRLDWAAKESVRAKLRVAVRRLLRKHGYPPDKQEKATQTVMEQAEALCQDWA